MKNDPGMKNEHENPDQGQPGQGQHERLCAYVFGELQGAEREAFEAELADSSSLRAEQECLTATIGLVKRAIPDEGLSSAVRRDVLASARRSHFRFLSGRRLASLVAAGLVLAGGALAIRWLARPNTTHDFRIHDLETARLPESSESPKAESTGRLAKELPARAKVRSEELEDLGYSSSIASGLRDQMAPAPAPAELTREELAELSSLGYVGGGGPAPRQRGDEGSDAFALQSNALFDSDAFNTPSPEPTITIGGGAGGKFAGRFGGSKTLRSAGGAAARPMAPGAPGGWSFWKRAGLREESNELDSGQENQRVLRGLGYGGDDESEPTLADGAGIKGRREVAPNREQASAKVEALLAATRLAPGESPRDMFFRYFGDAPFVPALEERLSTFAADVDTASFALTRAYLNRGELPPRAAVRTEEFVNYFRADQPAPTDGAPFALGLELAPGLFTSDPRMETLRVTVRGKDVADFERQAVALTFVIDNSGSMNSSGRLELVKRSLSMLLRQLLPGDSIAVVKFSGQAALVAPMTPIARRGELESLIQGLATEGGTNVEAGLRLGFEEAQHSLVRRAVNRVILCSDGVGNMGETRAEELLRLVQEARSKGIYLNTVGVGMGNHSDAFLEQLADRGDGVCHYVDSEAEAKRIFVDNLASAIQPIARDVKIQVEFDPTQVERWRLLGYENRALRTQDFRNDAIDAGEINAGHQVTALYELVRLPGRTGPLATLRLRYKPPFAIDQGKEGRAAEEEAEKALELARTLDASAVLPGFASASNGYQRAVLVAQFAEVLRRSVHARGDSLARLVQESQRLEKALGDPDFSEFVALLGKANPLLDARSKEEVPEVQQKLDELSRLHYELALHERKRELARQAGETETIEEAQSTDRALLEAIQRLEQEVNLRFLREQGYEELDDLGYGNEER